MIRVMSGLLVLLCLALPPVAAAASDPCPLLRTQVDATDAATRLAAAACEEHLRWHRPFIDERGRMAGSIVREAETALLTSGEQAWRRVAGYWQGAGLLAPLLHRAGAQDCRAAPFTPQPSAACRAFVVDVPWSAAFVSWAARRARLPGFRGSPSHVDYVRDAYRSPASSAYRVADPRTAAPARGDLLCYVRAADRSFGFAGLAAVLASEDVGLGMHCDIVVGAAADGLPTAHLVGGNLFDSVTLRRLPLDAGGRFAPLPTRAIDDPPCSPDHPHACDANRQDWAVLLQLRPPAELATLARSPPLEDPVAPMSPVPAGLPGRAPMCCVECSVGDGLPPCPGVDAPAGP